MQCDTEEEKIRFMRGNDLIYTAPIPQPSPCTNGTYVQHLYTRTGEQIGSNAECESVSQRSAHVASDISQLARQCNGMRRREP